MPLTSYSDPFIHMARANKTYGFTIAVKELRETVPNIFRYASAYKRLNNLTSQGLWEMFLEKPATGPEELPKDDPKYKKPLPEEILSSEPGRSSLPDIDPEAMEGESYNMCHFWSNFEIARLDWFRSKEYNEFFDMMDRSGGFWMERVRKTRGCNCVELIADGVTLRVSGATHPFTLSLRELCWGLRTYITFETSATDTPPYNIVPRTHRLVKCGESRT